MKGSKGGRSKSILLHNLQALAMKTAEQCEATLILANDPDTDRLAMAEREDTTCKKWDIFSGNEIGALLGWWVFKNYQERHPNFDGKDSMYHCL